MIHWYVNTCDYAPITILLCFLFLVSFGIQLATDYERQILPCQLASFLTLFTTIIHIRSFFLAKNVKPYCWLGHGICQLLLQQGSTVKHSGLVPRRRKQLQSYGQALCINAHRHRDAWEPEVIAGHNKSHQHHGGGEVCQAAT